MCILFAPGTLLFASIDSILIAFCLDMEPLRASEIPWSCRGSAHFVSTAPSECGQRKLTKAIDSAEGQEWQHQCEKKPHFEGYLNLL